MQVLRFQQKEDSGMSLNTLLDLNRAEAIRYKEQLLESVRYMNEEKSEWISDHNVRKSVFTEALKSGDYRKIFPLMNGVMQEKIKREKIGKQILSEDRKYLETAKKIFNSEVAFVFNLKESEVEKFVKNEMIDK